MKKILQFLLLFLSAMQPTLAQSYNISWGPEYKADGERQIIGRRNDKVYVYRYARKEVLECYDADKMGLLFSLDLELGNKDIGFNSTLLLDDRIIVFAEEYHEKTKKAGIYAKVIAPDGKVMTDWQTILETPAKTEFDRVSPEIRLSTDSSVLVMSLSEYDEPKAMLKNKQLFLNTQLEIQQTTEHYLSGFQHGTIAVESTGNKLFLGIGLRKLDGKSTKKTDFLPDKFFYTKCRPLPRRQKPLNIPWTES